MKTKFFIMIVFAVLFTTGCATGASAGPVAMAPGSFQHCAEVRWITTYDAYGYVHNHPVCTRVLRQYAHLYPQQYYTYDQSSGRTEAFIFGAFTGIVLDRILRDNRRQYRPHYNYPQRRYRNHRRHGVDSCVEYADRHGRLICR